MEHIDELRMRLDELRGRELWQNELYDKDLHDTIQTFKDLMDIVGEALNVLALKGVRAGAEAASQLSPAVSSPPPPVGPKQIICDGVKECAFMDARIKECIHSKEHKAGPTCGHNAATRCPSTPPPLGVCK